MGVLTVTRIAPQQLAAFQVSTANADVAFALENAMMEIGSPDVLKVNSGVNVPDLLMVTITQPSMTDQIAFPGDWVLVTDATHDPTIDQDTGEPVGWTVAPTTQVIVYGKGTGQVGNALDFVNTFTDNTPVVWAATTAAPVATAEAGLTATLVFPQPTSADGPWTYALNGPGTGTFSAPDANGNVTANITGLTEGASSSWTITVNTTYTGVTATSVATVAVTAFNTAPAPVTEGS
jgi:hypothetical protein